MTSTQCVLCFASQNINEVAVSLAHLKGNLHQLHNVASYLNVLKRTQYVPSHSE
jgi:hypothetical protein